MPKRVNTKPSREKDGKWKKGTVSPNPAGAPKRGESWAEVIKRVAEMTPSEAADRSLTLAKQLLAIGDGVTLKEAVVLRVYGALLFDPQGALFNALMDRADGKVAQQIDLNDLRDKTDSDLVNEFTDIVHAARTRAGAATGGGDTAAGAGEAED